MCHLGHTSVVGGDTDIGHTRAHPEQVPRPLHPPDDVTHAGWRPEVEHAAVLLAMATIIAVLLLLAAALLPSEPHHAPPRHPPTTAIE
jgi:hypothetical protein